MYFLYKYEYRTLKPLKSPKEEDYGRKEYNYNGGEEQI
jgi:hypothetical protein